MKRVRQIRIKEKTPRPLCQMTRRQAIRHVRQLLRLPCRIQAAVELIELFYIQPDELSEAGVTYEQLRALEEHCVLFRCTR